MKFSDITETKSMVSYLKENQRTNNIKVFSKYTGLDSVIELFKTGMLFINSPENMNDLYEYKAFRPISIWSKICFASFITQSRESMAMWGMYAQPWTEGVMLSLPAQELKNYLQGLPKLFNAEFNEKTNRYYPGKHRISSGENISLVRVAYFDGINLTCTSREDRNRQFNRPYEIPEFAGYIKDGAWDYEKEVRLRVDLPESYHNNVIFLQIPEEILQHSIITTGPRFEGNVLSSLPREYRANVRIEASKFQEKLAWIPCDKCKNNKGKR